MLVARKGTVGSLELVFVEKCCVGNKVDESSETKPSADHSARNKTM